MTELPSFAWYILSDSASTFTGVAGASGPEGAPPDLATARTVYRTTTGFTLHSGDGDLVAHGVMCSNEVAPSDGALESPILEVMGLLENAGISGPYEIGWPTL